MGHSDDRRFFDFNKNNPYICSMERDKINNLNHNKVLINIRNNYGIIEERLKRESLRILKDEYNINVGDIILDQFNNMGTITGVSIYGLHDHILYYGLKEDVTFSIDTHKINHSSGKFSKRGNRELSVYGMDYSKLKVVGNIVEHNTNYLRMKLYNSLNIKKYYV